MTTQTLHEGMSGTSIETEDSIRLQCTGCEAELGSLLLSSHYECSICHHTLQLEDGIWRTLPSARLAHFSQFIQDYQKIRAAEGRGSLQADFYLNLPYLDISGSNSWQWKIRAHTYDYLSKKLLPLLCKERKKPLRVLDLGAGNGWMSHRLALQGYHPVAVDLLVNDQDGLGAATHFQKHLTSLFPRFQAEMSRLPFAEEQFDVVIFNASFHYAENYEAALLEALRCTRQGGSVIVADSPWYSTSESGKKMIEERHASFSQRYGTASDSIASLEYLTDQRMRRLERIVGMRWERYTPHYGFGWAMRPLLAKLRRRREPSRFRIYIMRKTV